MLGQTSPAAARFEALDALRGICALLVVLFHIPIYHALKGTESFVNLQFCVDMFFALSGFVLCHAYGHRLDNGREGLRFAWMRFARLWPLHMVMLGLFVAIEAAKLVFMRADGSLALDSQPFGAGHSPWELVTNILFLQSFNLHSGLSWNGPAWSAAVEFYVSLLFAGVVMLFPRFRREIFLGLCLAAGWQLFERSPNSLFVSSDWGMLRAIFSFFAGCLAYDMRQHSNGRLETPNMLEAWSVLLFAAFVLTTPQGALQYRVSRAGRDRDLHVLVRPGPHFRAAALASAAEARPVVVLDLHGAHLRVPDREDGGLLYRPQNPSRTRGLAQQREAGVAGNAGHAVWLALIFSVVLVVPVAALTYRWIEKPALDAAKRGVSVKSLARTSGRRQSPSRRVQGIPKSGAP